MVSPLSPFQAQQQQLDITGSLLGGRQAYQQSQLANQAMQQNEQQITRDQYQMGVERLSLINKLATKARQLPADQRSQFVGSINQNVFKAVGIDPSQVASVPLDDGSLDDLIAQTGAAIPESMATAGERQFNALTKGLSEEDKMRARRVELGLDPRAVGSAAMTTADTGATARVAQSQAEIEAAKSGARTGAELDVRTEKEPELQAAISRAKEQAKAQVEKQIAQQGQLGKLSDAESVYNRLRDSDLDVIYGRGEKWYPEFLRSQKGIDLIADRDQLIGMLQLGARGELKGQGPITDSEQKILSNAVTVLNSPNISPERARSALDEAMVILRRNAGKTASVTSKYKIEVLD